MFSAQSDAKKTLVFQAYASDTVLSLEQIFNKQINLAVVEQLVDYINKHKPNAMDWERMKVAFKDLNKIGKRLYIVEVIPNSTGTITTDDIFSIHPQLTLQEVLHSTEAKKRNTEELSKIVGYLEHEGLQPLSMSHKIIDTFNFGLFDKKGDGPLNKIKSDDIFDLQPFKKIIFQLAGLKK